jgi:hypothetical protein
MNPYNFLQTTLLSTTIRNLNDGKFYQKQRSGLSNFTGSEMKEFLDLIIFRGQVKKDNMKDY